MHVRGLFTKVLYVYTYIHAVIALSIILFSERTRAWGDRGWGDTRGTKSMSILESAVKYMGKGIMLVLNFRKKAFKTRGGGRFSKPLIITIL